MTYKFYPCQLGGEVFHKQFFGHLRGSYLNPSNGKKKEGATKRPFVTHFSCYLGFAKIPSGNVGSSNMIGYLLMLTMDVVHLLFLVIFFLIWRPAEIS